MTNKQKYIFKNGFLWALSFTLIYSILTMLFNPRGISYSYDQIIVRFIVYLIISSVGGIIISDINWRLKKKKVRIKR